VHGIHTQPLENPHMDWMDQATTLSREERARLAKERHKALFSHYEKRCKEADVRSPSPLSVADRTLLNRRPVVCAARVLV
jgi:hypothetical protein